MTFTRSRKTTQLPVLSAAHISPLDVFHLVDVSACRSKQTTVADLAAAISTTVGSGTVTSVSVTTHDGVSGTVANPTTTPAISITLGNIVPTSVNSVVISGSSIPTLAVTGTTSISGPNTGDQTITLTGDVTGSGTSSFAATLATITSGDTTGGSTAIPVVTKDAKGRVTGITTAAVVAPASTLSGTTINPTVTNSSLQTLGTITSGVWTGTNVAVANGGTGASTTSGARTNLGLVIGTNVQAWDTQLDSLSSLAYSSNSLKGIRVNAGETGFELYTPTTGTVTSVGITGNSGIGVSGSPVTSSGSITLSLGNITPTTVNGLTISTTTGTFTVTNGKTLSVPLDASVSNTNTGDQTITLTSDVTGSGTGSFAATISNDAVTYSKMQNVSATSRVLGRKTSGAGDTEECTLSEVLDFVGSAAQGDILYRGASSWTRLGAGTDGQFLKTQGASANPVWAAVSGAAGGTVTTVSVATANGVSGTVSNPTTTPAITLTLGAITPTTVNSVTLSGSSTPSLAVIGATTVSGNNTGDQVITLTSDVTGSGTGSFVTTIANNAVTLAKMAQVSTQRFLGRTTAGTGNVEALTTTQATALLDVFLGDGGSGGAKGLVPPTFSGDAAKVLYGDATWKTPNAGTVTSVAVSVGSGMGVSGSPITSSGTIALSLDATLVALAAYNTNGILTQTSADTFVGRTITGTADKVTVTNGDGVSGNPTVTVASTYTGQTSIVTLGTVTTGVWTGTNVAVANGGTGSSTQSGARTNLGVAIGSDVQAWDTQLDSLASLAYTSNALKVVRVNSGATGFELATPTSGTVTSVGITGSDGIGVSGSPVTSSGSITLSLDNITVDTVNGLTIPTSTGTLSITNGKTLSVPLDASVSNTNTGDQLYTASGDATAPSSVSTLVLTLATVNSNVGTFGALASGGQPTYSPIFTVNAKGLVTDASHAAVVADAVTLIGNHLANNVLGSSLTSVGVLTSGTWQSTKINLAYGGTNADLSATGGTSQVLRQSSSGAAITVGQLAASDLSNGTTGSGMVVLDFNATLTVPVLASASFNILIANDTSSLIKGPTTGTLNLQAYNSTSSAYSTLAFLQSGATPRLFLVDETYIGGNFVYREFQGSNFSKAVLVADGGTGRLTATAYAVVCGGTTSTGAYQSVSGLGTTGQVLTSSGASALPTWTTISSGAGTVTSVAVSGANGIGVTGSPITSSGTISLTLGDITPTSVVATNKVRSGTSSNGVLAVWDNTNSREITLTGGNTVLTLGGTGNPSLSLASNLLLPSGGEVNWNGGDVILTHSSNLLTLSGGNLALGSNSVTSGTWQGSNITVPFGGTGNSTFTAYAPICAGTTAQGSFQNATLGATGTVFVSAGTGAMPGWNTFASLMNTWKATVTGYNASVRQFLTHDSSGNWEWKGRSVC